MSYRGLLTCLSACFAIVLSGCVAGPPIYPVSEEGPDRAFVRFEYVNRYPITFGQILVYDGPRDCTQPLKGAQELFARSNNPLLSEVNITGAWIPAGKPIQISGRGVVSVEHNCSAVGDFTPRAGAKYLLRLTQKGPAYGNVCVLEAFEEGQLEAAPSQDLKPVECGK